MFALCFMKVYEISSERRKILESSLKMHPTPESGLLVVNDDWENLALTIHGPKAQYWNPHGILKS